MKIDFSDFERGFMIVNCLMGSNMTECDQLEDTLVAMAMNATDMLAEQCMRRLNAAVHQIRFRQKSSVYGKFD